MEDRLITSSWLAEDDQAEYSLRPRFLNEYIGQHGVKEHMRIYIEAAKHRGEPLDHALLYGPPGWLLIPIAMVIGYFFVSAEPAVHVLNRQVEEVLYPAMEDFELDIVLGKGPAARSLRLELKPFTLVGATTRMGLLTSPLRDRFGIKEQLELYNPEELKEIIERSADIRK